MNINEAICSALRCLNRLSRKHWDNFTMQLYNEWVLYGVCNGPSASGDRAAIVRTVKFKAKLADMSTEFSLQPNNFELF